MGRWSIIEENKKQEFGELAGCRLKEVQKLAGILQEHLAEAGGIKTAYERFASDFQYGRYAEAVENASLCSEKLTGKLRKLVMESAVSPEKQKYTDYIYQPLFMAMETWCERQEREGLEVPAYEEAVVCFCHIYDRGRPETMIRDHDNIEEKQVVDSLGTFFLRSDGGLYLDTYHASCMGNGDRTEVFLMEKGRFPDWIRDFYVEKWVSKNMGIPNEEKSTG